MIPRQASDGSLTTLCRNHITPTRRCCNGLNNIREKSEQEILVKLFARIVLVGYVLCLLVPD